MMITLNPKPSKQLRPGTLENQSKKGDPEKANLAEVGHMQMTARCICSNRPSWDVHFLRYL
jgi:hypothetical protein